MPALSNETITRLATTAQDAGEIQAKFRYANYLAFEKTSVTVADLELAESYFYAVTNSDYAEYQHQALISLGILNTNKNPVYANELFTRIPISSQLYADACFYLGKLYSMDRDGWERNDIKALAYYMCAHGRLASNDPRRSEIHALPAVFQELTDDGFAITEKSGKFHVIVKNAKGADLMYKVCRFRHEIGEDMDSEYVSFLDYLNQQARVYQDDKLIRKTNFQIAKIYTLHGSQNGKLALEDFQVAVKVADRIVSAPGNANSRKFKKAEFLKNDLSKLLEQERNTPRTTGFVEPSKKVIAPFQTVASIGLQAVGLIIGNILDFCTGTISKLVDETCRNGVESTYCESGDKFFDSGFGLLFRLCGKALGNGIGFLVGGLAAIIIHPFRALYQYSKYKFSPELHGEFGKYANFRAESFVREEVSAKGNNNVSGKLFNQTSYGKMRNIFKWEPTEKHDSLEKVREASLGEHPVQPFFLQKYKTWQKSVAVEQVKRDAAPRFLTAG